MSLTEAELLEMKARANKVIDEGKDDDPAVLVGADVLKLLLFLKIVQEKKSPRSRGL